VEVVAEKKTEGRAQTSVRVSKAGKKKGKENTGGGSFGKSRVRFRCSDQWRPGDVNSLWRQGGGKRSRGLACR